MTPEKQKAYIEHIKFWHGGHDENHEHHPCEVYTAIKKGASWKRLIEITENVDDGIRESFETRWVELEKQKVIYAEDKLHKAMKDAQDSFWQTVVLHYPSIRTGDFPPDATFAFDRQCEKAIEIWRDGN